MASALILAASTAVVVAGLDDGDDGDDGDDSQELERAGSVALDAEGALEIDDEPWGYRITYRVTERGGSETTEEVVVSRPYASETTIRRGDEVIGLSRSAFGRVLTDKQVFAVGPALAGADLRLSPALEEATMRGWLEAREQREVAGRTCQVYRAASSVLGGSLQPPGAPEVEHADACFDARGLLLEEWWVVDGSAIRHRVATDVEETAPSGLGEAWEAREPTLPVDRGGGSLLRLRAGSAPPGPFFTVGGLPPGFVHDGRYSVVPPQAERFNDEAGRGSIVTSTADVWRRGIDLLVLDQGGSLERLRTFEPDPDNRVVPLAGLGDAELIVGLGGNEVRILREGGRFLRVLGTLSPEQLLDVARSLVESQGNEIVPEE